MRSALQSLTLYACNMIKDRLAKVLNHTVAKNGIILHDGNVRYPFLVSVNSRNVWPLPDAHSDPNLQRVTPMSRMENYDHFGFGEANICPH